MVIKWEQGSRSAHLDRVSIRRGSVTLCVDRGFVQRSSHCVTCTSHLAVHALAATMPTLSWLEVCKCCLAGDVRAAPGHCTSSCGWLKVLPSAGERQARCDTPKAEAALLAWAWPG
jgi:hypothetical protein